MSNKVKESEIKRSIEESEIEKYSFYKIYDLAFVILKLMNAFETEKYTAVQRKQMGNVLIRAEKPSANTKQVLVDSSLINFRGLQQDYDFNETLELYAFGPSKSRFQLNLQDESLDYIQDFADVLYDYRSTHEIKELSQKELEEIINRYLAISKEEIEMRKINNNKQNTKK